MKKAEYDKVTSIRLPKELVMRVQQEANKQDRTRNNMIKIILQRFFNEIDKKDK